MSRIVNLHQLGDKTLQLQEHADSMINVRSLARCYANTNKNNKIGELQKIYQHHADHYIRLVVELNEYLTTIFPYCDSFAAPDRLFLENTSLLITQIANRLRGSDAA